MKKKGIIVATIVMVLVLAVSLTTATYAWFNSQAQATVENLTIQTNAATGVQIAVYEGNKYYNGLLGYDQTKAVGSKWSGEAEGFGTLLDFAQVDIGTMHNAVTNTLDSDDYVYTEVDPQPAEVSAVQTLYYVNADGSITPGAGATDLANFTNGVWCSRAAAVAGNFYRPTGYDATTQPYGYYDVEANTKGTGWTSYYDLPIAMQSIESVSAILCSITINPTAEASENLYPGMAAATYVRITPYTADNTQAGAGVTFKPFDDYTYNNGSLTGTSGDAGGVYNFIVAHGAILSSDIYKIRVEIWVEGTDGECTTVLMNSTDFTVDFGFDIYKTEYDGTSDITPDGEGQPTYKNVADLTQEKPQA